MNTEAIARRLSGLALFALMMLTVAVLAPRAGAGMKEKYEMETMGVEKMAPQGMLSGAEGHRVSGTANLHSDENGRAPLGGGMLVHS